MMTLMVRIPAPEIHYSFRGWPVSLLELSFCGVSLWSLFPQESSCITFAGICLLIINFFVIKKLRWTNTLVRVSGGRRAVTPVGIARVRRPRRVIFSRRLRPCPRKASDQSDPGRRKLLRIIPNGNKLLRSLHQLRSSKQHAKSLYSLRYEYQSANWSTSPSSICLIR